MVAELVRRLPRSPRHVFVCGGNPFVEAASRGALRLGHRSRSHPHRALRRLTREAKGAASNSDPSLQRALGLPTPWSSRSQALDWAWTYRQQTSPPAPSSAPCAGRLVGATRRRVHRALIDLVGARRTRGPEAPSFAQPRRPKCRRCRTTADALTSRFPATRQAAWPAPSYHPQQEPGTRPSKTATAVPISKRFMFALLEVIPATGNELLCRRGHCIARPLPIKRATERSVPPNPS